MNQSCSFRFLPSFPLTILPNQIGDLMFGEAWHSLNRLFGQIVQPIFRVSFHEGIASKKSSKRRTFL